MSRMRRLAPGEQWYLRLLSLYPEWFRSEFGDDLLLHYRDLARDARARGRLPVARLWCRLAAETAVEAVRQHVRVRNTRAARRRALPFPREVTMRDVRLDLKASWRGFRRTPIFTLAAIVTLGLGIGANTALFSVVNGVLLRPLPLEAPERVVFITRDGDVSIPDGRDWRARARTLESTALFLRMWGLALTGSGEPEMLHGNVVEPEYFRVLRAEPLLGRLLTESDNVAGGPRVVVISEGFWRGRFNADPNVIGRTITLSEQPNTIVGVLSARFDFLQDGIAFWVPVGTETPWALEERGTNNFDAIGRLAEGATLTAAQQELRAITTELAAQYPRTNRNKIVEPIGLLDYMVGAVRPALLALLGAVGALLLLASVNLASLLLARAARRRDELAVRVALGAHQWRLLRQSLVEGLMLSMAGGVLGVMVAVGGTRLLLGLAPSELPRVADVGVDWRVLLFAIGLAVLTGLVFGLIPGIMAARIGPRAAARGGTSAQARGRHRTLRSLVTIEVALALVLLIGGGLLIRTFQQIWNTRLGFSPEGVVVANLLLPESRYGSRDAQTRAYQAVIEELQTIPGVTQAAYATSIPLSPRGGVGNAVVFDGRPDIPPDAQTGTRGRPVLGQYFAALQIPVLQGRAFTNQDREGSEPVAVINEAFARRWFQNREPIGARLRWRDWGRENGFEPQWMTIVGVVSDVKGGRLQDPDDPVIYVPYAQRQVTWQRFGWVLLKTSRLAPETLRHLEEAVWRVDPSFALTELMPLASRQREVAAQERMMAQLVGAFALVALLLAMQGVLGVAMYQIEQRRREIGIRMALGARRPSVIRMVVREGITPVLIGTGLGVGMAFLAVRAIQSLLWGVSPFDPLAFALAVTLLVGGTAVGMLFPARKATRVDPAIAFRAE